MSKKNNRMSYVQGDSDLNEAGSYTIFALSKDARTRRSGDYTPLQAHEAENRGAILPSEVGSDWALR